MLSIRDEFIVFMFPVVTWVIGCLAALAMDYFYPHQTLGIFLATAFVVCCLCTAFFGITGLFRKALEAAIK
jgi:hypothetical protein